MRRFGGGSIALAMRYADVYHVDLKEDAMALWDFLFDSDIRQRKDIDNLELKAESTDEALQRLSIEVQRLRRQQDLNELVLEALLQLAELKGQVSREEIALMIQRLDLADGVEDGRIGPDRCASSPKCPFCDRPVNPERVHCIYCGQSQPEAAQAPAKKSPQARLIRCVRC